MLHQHKWFTVWLLTALAIILQCSPRAEAQVPTFQDCLGATPICLGSWVNGNLITGTGNYPNEINPATSCLLTGERNDVWYIITTGSAGSLGFSVVPNNLTQNYDWAVYNLTSATCADIFSTPSLEVACNYSNLPGITGPNGLPGAQNSAMIIVSAGQTYLINVSGFSSFQQSGYTLDFSSSTASVVDNTPPAIGSITSMNCGATSMMVSFSERVLCSSVQASDFLLTGPGGPYTVNSVSNAACATGATYSRDYSISFSPAIPGAGTYTLTLAGSVTDLCANNAVVPQNFLLPISGVNITFQKIDVTCFGGNNGSATATVSGAPGPYTYQWSPMGGSGATAQFLTAGTYTVTVTSSMGCSATSSVTINQPLTGITASVSVTPSNGCAANGSATVSVSSGQAPYQYSWWPTGGNAASATGLTAGGYMVTITDANQCVLNYFLNVPSASGPSIAITSTDHVSCFGGNDGSATVSVSNATGPFSYQWSPSGGTGATATGLTAGNYTIEVIVAPGCTLTTGVTIVEPPTALSVGVSSTNTSCGNNNGSISLTASGGAGSYTYQWSPNVSNGASASALAGGTYNVTVTDANGCTSVNTINILSSTQPVIALTGHFNVSCFGLSDGATGITISGGTLPIGVQWSNMQTTPSINGLSAGTYTVIVTDALGCTASLTDVITQPAQLTAAVQNIQHVNCFGDLTGSASVITTGGNGGNTWSWSGLTATGSSANNIGVGNYTATVTDLMGCSAQVLVTVNGPSSPLTTQGTVTPTTCGNNDGSVSTQTTGGTSPYSYQWSNGSSTGNLSSVGAGVYSVTVTDAGGCTMLETFVVQASNAPVVTLQSSAPVTCNGGSDGSATLSVSGGVQPYAWSWQGGVATGATATGLAAGIYNVTVTDATGCAAIHQVTVAQPDPLQLQVLVDPANAICIGESASLTVSTMGGTAPYNYQWGNGFATAQIQVSPQVTTSYSLTVTDANGCFAPAQQVTVQVNDPIQVTTAYPDSVCKGLDATVALTVTGGDGNYNYVWSNGLTGSSNNFIINTDISITVVVTDGCATPGVQSVINITAVNAPDLQFTLPVQAGCVPLEASFPLPSGVPGGLSYHWDFGNGFVSSQPSPSHTYVQPGVYDVTLRVAYITAAACSTELIFPQAIRAYDVPVARFIFDPPAPTLNKPDIYFTDRSTGAARWNWSFGDGSVSDVQNPRHSYSDTGTFVVSMVVMSTDGCRDSTSDEVVVRDDMELFIPNAFTPDGSGVNDYFKIYGVGFTSYEIAIYDRWGKLVHTARNREQAWDGTDQSSGKPVPQGLYVYKVTVTDHNGKTHQRISQVTVLR